MVKRIVHDWRLWTTRIRALQVEERVEWRGRPVRTSSTTLKILDVAKRHFLEVTNRVKTSMSCRIANAVDRAEPAIYVVKINCSNN
jgi:hypothetical protein